MKLTGNPTQSGDWSIQWINGELCEVDTAMKLLEHLAKLKKNADSAKIFQGTINGKPAVYVVTRWT
jgi:hypothetical protein